MIGQHLIGTNVPPPNAGFGPPMQRPRVPGIFPPDFCGVRLPRPNQIQSYHHPMHQVNRFPVAHRRPGPPELAGGNYQHWQRAPIIPSRLPGSEMRLQLQSEMHRMYPPGPSMRYPDPPLAGMRTMLPQGMIAMHNSFYAQQPLENTGNQFFHDSQEHYNQWTGTATTSTKSGNKVIEEIVFNAGKDCRQASKSHSKEDDVNVNTSESSAQLSQHRNDKKEDGSRRHESRSPSRRDCSSSRRRETKPSARRERSSPGRESRSPLRRERNSPRRQEARPSAMPPVRKDCKSPERRDTNSYVGRNNKLSPRGRDKSPTVGDCSSPARRTARREGKSSSRQDSKSPARRTGQPEDNSPVRRTARREIQSSARHDNRSPARWQDNPSTRRISKSPPRREDTFTQEGRTSSKGCDRGSSSSGTPRKRDCSQLNKSTDSSESKRSRSSPSRCNDRLSNFNRENTNWKSLSRRSALHSRSRSSFSQSDRKSPGRRFKPVSGARRSPGRISTSHWDSRVSPRQLAKPVHGVRERSERRHAEANEKPEIVDDAGRCNKSTRDAWENPGQRSQPASDADQNLIRENAIPGASFLSKRTESAYASVSQESDKTSLLDEGEEEIIEEEYIPDWIRSSPADLYFKRDKQTCVLNCTKRMLDLEKKFEGELIKRAERVRAAKPPVVLPPRKSYEPPSQPGVGSTRDDRCGNDSGDEDGEEQTWLDELNWRKIHPERLHEELWFNLPHEMNDGPLCRCSSHDSRCGVRHNIYPGEKVSSKCNPTTNNPDNLYHYRITMSPHTNFLTKSPTVIEFDGHEYIFEGFSLFSHYKIDKVPLCKVIRFNIEYTIHYFEEDMVENFDVRSLDLFADYVYREILELYDLDWAGRDYEETCRRFHIMPRFSRNLSDNGKEILSMNEVINYLLRSSKLLCEQSDLATLLALPERDWQKFVDEVRGMIVTYPGMRPCSVRIDQLDREQKDPNVIMFPKIVHFGVRPAQLSYAGDPTYQKLWKQYIRLKHLVANKPKVTLKDREKLRQLEEGLQDIRLKGTMKRETTVEISSEGFIRTGIKSDVCQHALLLPVLVQHLLFHKCLDVLEELIVYTFKDRLLLQLALTHPSFRMNYGTNADHARNSLTNCGRRQLEYGDKRIHFIHTRKRGINTLMYIMSKMANTQETASEINHYERLEFLGDAVIEFLSSIHLFFMFPRLEEGGLATYRAALVQNQHLSVLAEKMGLQHFMLYAHGPDLCNDLNIRHALANCFEALMGALFLDGGIQIADLVFGEALFKNEDELLHIWTHLPPHPLQDDEPNGDRHWIAQSLPLQNLVKFEEATGIVFNHVRLLARAFTMRNIGFNNLTLGHNQTLEFLGDTVLQLISSDYLFRHFPDHHEGHLTLLRSSLVNNRTQAIICDDLGMTEFVINNDLNVKERINNEQNKVKDKADIVEAFIGALYVDQGIEACTVFCQVCFFPRLKEFIMNQDWNDAKSQLQQCCLTLRDTTVGEPDIPVYKVLQSIGPTNTRRYHVAVYFRGERLATDYGHSIQQAEMNTAAKALREKADLFPHLLHTKRFLDWRFGQMKDDGGDSRAFKHAPMAPPSSSGLVRRVKCARGGLRASGKPLPKRSEKPSSIPTSGRSRLKSPPRKRNPAVRYDIANKLGKKKSASRVT